MFGDHPLVFKWIGNRMLRSLIQATEHVSVPASGFGLSLANPKMSWWSIMGIENPVSNNWVFPEVWFPENYCMSMVCNMFQIVELVFYSSSKKWIWNRWLNHLMNKLTVNSFYNGFIWVKIGSVLDEVLKKLWNCWLPGKQFSLYVSKSWSSVLSAWPSPSP